MVLVAALVMKIVMGIFSLAVARVIVVINLWRKPIDLSVGVVRAIGITFAYMKRQHTLEEYYGSRQL